MVLDKRCAQILSLIRQASSPTHAKELTKELGVSQRTIYYDVNKINEWLYEQDVPLIENIHGEGFWLPDFSKKHLNTQDIIISNKWDYQYSESERVLMILAKVLTENSDVTMRTFLEITQMSRGTIVKDLLKVKENLEEYGLSLNYLKSVGYQVCGSEEAKRELLSNLLSNILLNKDWDAVRKEIYNMVILSSQYGNQEIQSREEIIKLIYKAERQLGINLTDEMVEMLVIQLLIVVKRVNSKQFVVVDPEEKKVLGETKHHQTASIIAERLSNQFNVEIPEDEICFLTMNLLGLKVNYDGFDHYTERERMGLRSVVKRLIDDFQAYACVIFSQREELEENLLLHIKPTYYRLKYGVRTSNNLTESIKQNHSDIYHFTRRVMIHLEYYVGETVPDEEIAYIALHFGGWLTKEKKQVTYKYKGIIVCENGIGTSNMLKTQLESLIAGLEVVAIHSVRGFQAKGRNADIIFSTNNIKEDEIPVIQVPAILSNYDKEQILQRVNDLFQEKYSYENELDQMLGTIQQFATIHDQWGLKKSLSKIVKGHRHQVKEPDKPMLKELLTKQTIQFNKRVSNWEEAIRVTAEPLLTQKVINQGYVDAMIENVNELGPYIVIAPNIALPHARPEAGVEQVGMSLLKLEEAVYFSEKEKHAVQLIIVLAAIDNETHLKALSQLTEILSNEENVQTIINSNKSEDIIELINK